MHFAYSVTHVYTHPNDAEYLWHVVPGMLFDYGYDLSQLFEEVFPHPSVARTDHTQEGGHHLHGAGGQCMVSLPLIP